MVVNVWVWVRCRSSESSFLSWRTAAARRPRDASTSRPAAACSWRCGGRRDRSPLSAASALTGAHAMQQALGGAVVDQAEPHGRRRPAGGERVQLTGDRVHARHAQPGAQQRRRRPRGFPGESSALDARGVVVQRRRAEGGGRGGQQRPSRSHRRLASLPRQLDRGQPLVGARDDVEIDAPSAPVARCAQASATRPTARLRSGCRRRAAAVSDDAPGAARCPLWAKASRPYESV